MTIELIEGKVYIQSNMQNKEIPEVIMSLEKVKLLLLEQYYNKNSIIKMEEIK